MRTVTPQQFTRQMRSMPSEIEKANQRGVAKAAQHLTTVARRNIAVASGGDSRLSHIGKRGARVGARYRVRNQGTTSTALVSAEGPLQIIERDTKSHGELPKGVGRAKGRSKAARHEAKQALYDALFGTGGFSGVKPLSTPYGPRYRVQHPGTKGKHPFGRAVDSVLPHTPPIFQREIRESLRKVFG